MEECRNVEDSFDTRIPCSKWRGECHAVGGVAFQAVCDTFKLRIWHRTLLQKRALIMQRD